MATWSKYFTDVPPAGCPIKGAAISCFCTAFCFFSLFFFYVFFSPSSRRQMTEHQISSLKALASAFASAALGLATLTGSLSLVLHRTNEQLVAFLTKHRDKNFIKSHGRDNAR